MINRLSNKLILTEDEISEILRKPAQYHPSQIPVALFKIYYAKLLLKKICEFKEELDKEVDALANQLDL
jgi:hypothetical protein